ncbi:MAG: 50S ribosomal protein L10 [Dehalococcoidia bacterium]
MPTPKKVAVVAELKDLVERSSIVIGAEYRGLTVREMIALRRAMREAGVEVRVVKNRLFQIAAQQAGVADAGQVAEGPSIIVFGLGDIIAPAKAVTEYARTARNAFAPRKAYLEGAIHPASLLSDLATLPSREELIAKLAGAFISPMQDLANLLERALGNPAGILLNDSLRTFEGLLEARAGQLEAA